MEEKEWNNKCGMVYISSEYQGEQKGSEAKANMGTYS
jgi:hypothetical protein